MRCALLDKNVCSHKFARRCSAGELVETMLLRQAIRDDDDPIVIREAIRQNRLLITNDLSFVIDNERKVPACHPGIVIVDVDDEDGRTMTWKIAEKILGNFKSEFPEWHSAPWHNSIIELRPSRIRVSHMKGNSELTDYSGSRQSLGWQAHVLAALQANAAIDVPPPS